MSAPQNIIAVIFDFDDTLTDDSTTQLLEHYGIDAKAFWQECGKMAEIGWDPTLAYTTKILNLVGPGKPLDKLSNADLRAFGEKLRFYPGIPQIFKELKALCTEHPISSPAVEFYVISGGLEEVIRGTKIAKWFSGICGCRFAEGDGAIRHLQNAVSFTDKTRYVFEINKGLAVPCRDRPYAVNEYVAETDRRIPLPNMIYVGDGFTDVPCFSLIQKNGGFAFGVFDPKREGSPKKAWEKLAAPHRVTTLNAPRFRKTDELGAILRAIVKSMLVQMDSRTKQTS
jgi:2-hydroxy-3-keto-5-methylthiopentenyl-1-phosphate phosphatase